MGIGDNFHGEVYTAGAVPGILYLETTLANCPPETVSAIDLDQNSDSVFL
jgi:hypothetical protein